ncbi:MAG: hypothetical protein PHF54_03475, partial [Candidatus Pacebacteria bacterium]|nr:hypothetical protein [Candidatus Paceibacterota bacterium]
LALSIGALPDVNGDVEVYVALPYVASLNTFGTNKETWIPSVTDNLSRSGLTLRPDTNNVGIGTSTPGYKLEVNGTGKFTSTVSVGTPTANDHAVTKLYVDSAISGTTQGTVTSITAGSGLSGGTITTSGTIAVDSTVIRTTGNQTLGGTKTFSSAVVLSTAGTLTTHAVRADRSISTGSGLSGGGNLTANRTLTVDSTVIRTTGDQTLGGIKTFSSPVVVPTPTGSTHATTKAYVDSMFSGSGPWTLSGSNVYVTSTSNNVGIGTTSPRTKNEVAYSTGGTLPGINWVGQTISRSDATSDAFGSALALTAYQNKGATLSAGGTGFDISTYDGISTPIARLSILSTGNVGIGQTSPGYKLDVSGTGRFTGTVSVATPTASNHATTKAYVDSMFSGSGPWTLSGSNVYVTNTSNNVGIGTTSPGNKLTVNGSMRIVTPTGAGLLAYDASSGGSYIFSLTRTSGVHTNDLNIGALNGFAISTGVSAVPSSSYDFYINSSGNVGIGTTSPAAKLTIADGGSAAGARILDIGDDSYLTDVDSANTLGVYGIQNSTIGSIKLGSTGGSISGYDYNIGINQASPAYRLDVGGTGRFTGTVVVATPTSSNHATTKAYVDSMFSGSGPWTLSGSNVYVTNTDHNVGIGTTSPSYKLDINGSVNLASSLNIAGKAVLSLPSNNPETGPWNPIWNAIGSSKPLYFDEEFASGSNSVGVYNNAGGTAVTVTRLTGQTGIPNSTGSVLRVSYDGVGATSPGYGGVVLIFNSSANKTYVQRFRAKLPVGRNFVLAENDQGDNRTSYWLTNTAGTGKWEDYIRVSHAGNTGSFSSGGHIYVTGGTGAFDWYIASMNVYEVNVPIIASANTWVSQQTFNGGTRFPGSGIWNTSGNVGINDTTPDYKLDVNGTGRFTGTVSVATPTSSNHATTKAYVDSLVASNPSGTVTSITAGSGLSGGTITT